MGREPLLIDHPADGVRRVRLNRPDRRNAIDQAIVDGLHEVVGQGDEPLLVLGSTDHRAFSAGADLALDASDFERLSDALFALYQKIVTSPRVVLMAVDGHVIGAGAQLLLAADLRIGGPSTQISFSGVASGLAVGTWGLTSLVGRGRAMDLSLTGRTVAAEEAARIGLLERLVEDPAKSAVQIAGDLARARPSVLMRVKQLTLASGSVADRIFAERAVNAGVSHVSAGSRRSRSE